MPVADSSTAAVARFTAIKITYCRLNYRSFLYFKYTDIVYVHIRTVYIYMYIYLGGSKDLVSHREPSSCSNFIKVGKF